MARIAGMHRQKLLRKLYMFLIITATVYLVLYSQGLHTLHAIRVRLQGPSIEFLGILPFILGSRCRPEGTKISGISTPGCNIPDLDPCDEAVRKYIRPAAPLSCGGSHVSLTSVQNGRLVVDQKLATSRAVVRCEYSPILHDTRSDSYLFADPVTFTSSVDVSSLKFIRVYCFSRLGSRVYTNFHPVIVRDESRKRGRRDEEGKRKLQVLILGLDSMSRLNLARQLPNYKALLEKEGFVGMNGYHKVALNTFVNVVPAMTGYHVDESGNYSYRPFDGRLIWQDYMDAGAYSLLAEDAPEMTIFSSHKRGFNATPTDFYMRPLSTAMFDEKGWYGWKIYKSCAGPKPEAQYSLDYSRDFTHIFRNDSYLQFLWLTRLHHNDVNDAGQVDNLYTSYMSDLLQSGVLNDTVVLSFSDHGIRMGPIHRTVFGQGEDRLPFLHVRLPAWLRAQCPECHQNLRHNAKRLTTPFDVYSTLRHLLTPHIKQDFRSPISNGYSLLTRVPDNRTCEDALIFSVWCSCRHFRELPRDDPAVARAASALLRHLNDILSDAADVCATLTVKSVTSAHVDQAKIYGTDYKLTVVADPSEGVFQAVVRKSPEGELSVVDDVNRINVYGNQSYCAKKYTHKPYCYCMTFL